MVHSVVLKDLLIAEQVIGRRNTTHILAAHVKVKVLYRALHIKLERNVCYLFNMAKKVQCRVAIQ